MSTVHGVGVDLVQISGFRQQLGQDGTRFHRVFTARERRYCARSDNADASLAVRWAAREAFVKAWSCALIGRPPVLADSPDLFSLIEVVTDAWSRPSLALHGAVAEAFTQSLPGASVHISLSHDGDYAQAVAIISG